MEIIRKGAQLNFAVDAILHRYATAENYILFKEPSPERFQ